MFLRLVCEVSYICANQVGPPMSFRKYFKFQVVKPLDVKTKFYNAEVISIYLISIYLIELSIALIWIVDNMYS